MRKMYTRSIASDTFQGSAEGDDSPSSSMDIPDGSRTVNDDSGVSELNGSMTEGKGYYNKGFLDSTHIRHSVTLKAL